MPNNRAKTIMDTREQSETLTKGVMTLNSAGQFEVRLNSIRYTLCLSGFSSGTEGISKAPKALPTVGTALPALLVLKGE